MRVAPRLVLSVLAVFCAGAGVCQEIDWPLRGSWNISLPAQNTSVTSLVAGESGLYFLIRGSIESGGATVLHTDAEGAVLDWIPLAGQQINGMAVDAQGNQYVLSGDRTLLTYDSHGIQSKSVSLDTPASALSLVHGEPWGIRPDHSLEPLAANAAATRDGTPRFHVIASGPGLTLYPVRDGAVALIDGDTVRILDLDGRSASSSMNPARWIGSHPGMRLRSLAADGDKAIFVLGASSQPGVAWILQMDQTGHPQRSLRVNLPAEASPTLIGISGTRLYLADPQGHVWYADAPSAGVPLDQRLDSSPVLISSMEPFRQALRKAGYTAAVSLSVTVDEQGRVRQIEIRQHAGNPLPQQALDLAAQWRFEPAVKGGKAVSSTMQIEVGR